MKNYELTKAIPARKKAEFMRYSENAETKKDIFDFAKKTAVFYGEKFGWTVEDIKLVTMRLYACGYCFWNIHHSLNVWDYLVNYINWKMRIGEKLNDLGAFGDGLETALHLINCRKIWRSRVRVMHVSEIGKTDITINRIKFEVGHNGKTWADSLPTDEMHGPFDGVIYGVISEDEKQAISELFRTGRIQKALTVICELLYVWEDKNSFLNFMQSQIGRSKTIVYKPAIGRFQTVYNPSKHNAFIQAVERENIPTLKEYFLNLGENDFLE